jgi:flavin reductase
MDSVSRVASVLEANGTFVANILAVEQEEAARVFAGMVPELRDDKFAVGQRNGLASGSPALDGTVCNLDCQLVSLTGFGSQLIDIDEVLTVRTGGAAPLVFSDCDSHRFHA